ncbi:hypothetical protein PLESTB_001360500 [Pleodorina starrii]|uniref:Uncharacterized protein n=1 Tax=Pleodorina starrii TaxID=330485 RepID=A0A9W6F6N4_9CHLO|nr:hypothetical protein PLESTM_002067100 [Pleodorina starrii]GLC58452.1 hypothetical protein PLESTB_001360500 [Pleodorina starrii]GLC77442.1 hypothetical protein PLESTF_001936500 [Pleodorina starrii]
MLSWKDDDDAFAKRSPLSKAGSLARPGSSFEAQRTTTSRKSVEVPVALFTNRSGEPTTLSPTNSLQKTNSQLRGPGYAAEGTIGSEGWWHHMDHSQMNEAPVDGATATGQAKAGFCLPYNLTGQKQTLWADETPAAAAPSPASPVPAAPAPAVAAAAEATPAAPAPAAAAPVAPAPAAATGGDGSAVTQQNAATTGWWVHMDNSILNQPAETGPLAPGAVRKGERVMGGGFTPQFSVAGGNRYGSIFPEETQQQQQPGDAQVLEQKVASWTPFCGPQGGSATGDDDWSNFASAPKA